MKLVRMKILLAVGIKMDFKKMFESGTLENGLNKQNFISFSLTVENSSAWRGHVKKCKVAKIVNLNFGGEDIEVIDEKGNRLLDEDAWRKGLENRAKLMLENKDEELTKEEIGMSSQNFKAGVQDGSFYENHLLAVGCMCGTNVDINEIKQEHKDYVASSAGEVSVKKTNVYF